MVNVCLTYKEDKIYIKLQIVKLKSLDIIVIGVTGSGKSITLNILFQK